MINYRTGLNDTKNTGLNDTKKLHHSLKFIFQAIAVFLKLNHERVDGSISIFFLKMQLIQNMNAYCKSLHKTSAKLMSSSTVLSLIFSLPTSSKSMEFNKKFSFIIYLKQNHQFFNNISLWKHSTLFVFYNFFLLFQFSQWVYFYDRTNKLQLYAATNVSCHLRSFTKQNYK